jgi:hypothetical protein
MINYLAYMFVVISILLMAICIYGISSGWADDKNSNKEWKNK